MRSITTANEKRSAFRRSTILPVVLGREMWSASVCVVEHLIHNIIFEINFLKNAILNLQNKTIAFGKLKSSMLAYQDFRSKEEASVMKNMLS